MRLLFVFLLLPFFPFNSFGQWSGHVNANTASTIIATADGGSLVVGSINQQPTCIKLDRFGRKQWQRIVNVNGEYFPVDAVEHPDGRFTVLLRYNFQTENTNLLQLDANGQVLWHRTLNNGGLFCRAYRFIRTQDDGFLIGVSTDAVYEKRIYKTDADGNVQFIYIPPGTVEGYILQNIKQTPDNQFEAVYQEGYVGNLLIINRFSEQGLQLSSDSTQFAYQYGNTLVSAVGNDRYLSIGTGAQSGQLYATLFSDHGDLIWEKPLVDQVGTNGLKALIILSDGSFVVERNLGLVSRFNKYDASGNPVWARAYDNAIDLLNYFLTADVTSSADDGLLVAAISPYQNGQDVLAFSISPDGKTKFNQVAGTLNLDANLDCADGSEPLLSNWQVELQKPGDTVVVNTDASGYYKTSIDTGTYQVRAIPINNLWEACPLTSAITNTVDQLSITQRNFAIQPAALCPRIEIDITTPFLRRCLPGQYFIHCHNAGSKIADSVQVVVVLDPFIEYNTASIALAAQHGDSLFFHLGPLDVGESKDFHLDYVVNCDSTVIGQTHCTKALVYPNELCSSINQTWSGASLDLAGECAGDSVRFLLKNNGVAAMLAPAELQLVRDGLLDSTITYQLNANQSLAIIVSADGSTWRLQTPQITDHPFYGLVSSTVEGCTVGGNQNFSTGFVTQFPTEDASPFVAVDCRENIGSFDPNDKSVAPRGRGPERLVAPNTDLEYMVRFQNTGTDTAFNIMIRDTLTAALAPYSIVPGAASHPYTWGFDGPRHIYFSFKNILLPDSTTNESASHGFISFKIKQAPDNPNGTKILNRAGIYFDFNPPVITNSTYLLVARDVISASLQPVADAPGSFSIWPNPADATITVVSNRSNNKGDLEISIHDLMGKTCLQTRIPAAPSMPLRVSQLPAGVYFIRLAQSGRAVQTQKLIIAH